MYKYAVIYLAIITILLTGCTRGTAKEAPEETSEEQASEQETDHKLRIGEDGAPMVLIPAGEFQMGSNDGYDNEKPVHKVYLDAYYIDKYEVTNALYKKFIDTTGYEVPGHWNDTRFNAPNQPVVSVTWHDAMAYAEWAGKRLPTEAQWEKAARGGMVGKIFPWGDESRDGTQSNFADRNTNYSWSYKGVDDGYQYTAPVDSFAPNGYGLYNMAGNVWEWCADWYDENYYKRSPKRNPTGPGSGTYRVLRGGSWYGNPVILRIANRNSYYPTSAYYYLGFRCILQETTQ